MICVACSEMLYKTVGFCAVTLDENKTSCLHSMLAQHPNLLTNTLFSNIEYLHPGQSPPERRNRVCVECNRCRSAPIDGTLRPVSIASTLPTRAFFNSNEHRSGRSVREGQWICSV